MKSSPYKISMTTKSWESSLTVMSEKYLLVQILKALEIISEQLQNLQFKEVKKE